MRESNYSLSSQISENIRLEKQVEIQQNVITELKSKADLIEKDDSGQLSSKDQVAELLVDIENLEAINKEKAILLETVKTENAIVSDKLDILEEKNKELENYIERLHKDTVKDVAISEELSSTNFNLNVTNVERTL